MSLFDIEKVLQKALKNVPNIPDVAWPNSKFTPVKGTSFVRPTLLPAKAEAFSLSDGNKHSGIYQIDIYVPMNKGIKKLYEIADSIREYYKANKRLTTGDNTIFVLVVDVGGSERQEDWYSTFVEIQYLNYQ